MYSPIQGSAADSDKSAVVDDQVTVGQAEQVGQGIGDPDPEGERQ